MTPSTRLPRFSIRAQYVACLITALGATACAGGSSVTGPTTNPPPAPTAGWLTLQIDTPNTNDGAVQFVVTGPALDSVNVIGLNGYASLSGTEADILVTGSIGNGTVAQIKIPDLSRVSEYRASVVAAAARSTYALQDVSVYRALLVR